MYDSSRCKSRRNNI
ncbi:hypothetical protein [Gottfriedia endophytica]